MALTLLHAPCSSRAKEEHHERTQRKVYIRLRQEEGRTPPPARIVKDYFSVFPYYEPPRTFIELNQSITNHFSLPLALHRRGIRRLVCSTDAFLHSLDRLFHSLRLMKQTGKIILLFYSLACAVARVSPATAVEWLPQA